MDHARHCLSIVSDHLHLIMDTVSVPSLKDLTIENITENVHAINSQCSDQRLKFLLERTVSHLHDLARETRLTTDEWMATLLFLTRVGQISSDVRQVRIGCFAFRRPSRTNVHAGIHLAL